MESLGGSDFSRNSPMEPTAQKLSSQFFSKLSFERFTLYADSDDYEKNLGVVKDRIYLYLADEIGFLKVWDLTYLVAFLKFSPAPNYPKTKVSFNAKRKENIDYSIHMSSIRSE